MNPRLRTKRILTLAVILPILSGYSCDSPNESAGRIKPAREVEPLTIKMVQGPHSKVVERGRVKLEDVEPAIIQVTNNAGVTLAIPDHPYYVRLLVYQNEKLKTEILNYGVGLEDSLENLNFVKIRPGASVRLKARLLSVPEPFASGKYQVKAQILGIRQESLSRPQWRKLKKTLSPLHALLNSRPITESETYTVGL